VPGQVEIVVVYNERPTLERVFLESSGLAAARVTLIDNADIGRGLPTHFNEHTRGAVADWLVLCHQDFVVFERDWLERITRLSPDACYGPIGIDRAGQLLGRIRQTDDSWLGLAVDGADVIGLDELCPIVPRTIYQSLDFDERFAFDLYVHDYRLAARRAGFGVKTFQLDCQHRSKSLTGDVKRASYLHAKETYIALDSIVELFSDAGFEIRDLHRTRIGVFDTEIALDPSEVSPSAARRVIEDPEATVYQFVFRAIPSRQRTSRADLRDTTFDPRREREAFAATCMGRAWAAFHRDLADRPEARAWARLAIAAARSVKTALYWLVSFLPFQLKRR
jgi:hypothetical protein